MKYQGNKRRFAAELIGVMSEFRRPGQAWVEPFCGSCSVIGLVDGPRYANDKNRFLVAMLQAVARGDELPMRIERDYYCDVRSSYNAGDGRYPDYIVGWVGFMGSFNGRFFDGGYSGHSVQVRGGVRDYIGEDIADTLRQAGSLNGIVWSSGDYSDMAIPDNSLIYCDIPYKDTKQYSVSRGFCYEAFYEWCRKMRDAGHTVFVSEYAMPDDFECVWSKATTCAMNQSVTKKPTEKLFRL